MPIKWEIEKWKLLNEKKWHKHITSQWIIIQQFIVGILYDLILMHDGNWKWLQNNNDHKKKCEAKAFNEIIKKTKKNCKEKYI